ncbi:MAG: pyridoxal-phosphate dependent enzyme [Chloroflexi bacterium]|nr:pyridoxal-phosphate dependent enzyme [Chloroflexota bacterium]
MNTLTMPTILDVFAAGRRLRGLVRQTAIEPSPWLGERTGADVLLKLECQQHTGSFKTRGALNRVLQLSAAQRARGLVTASAGNAGLGLAYAAHAVIARATVVVPTTAAATKVAALRRSGATLVQHGSTFDEADACAHELAAETGGLYVSAYNDADLIAGQGTVALEVFAERPDVARLLVPTGGGSLLGGCGLVARAVAPRCRVAGVQAATQPSMAAALAAGRGVPISGRPTLADGLAGSIEEDSITVPLAQQVADEIVLVEESAIEEAIRQLLAEHHLVVEGAGAVGVAALLSRAVLPEPGECVVCIVSGGNLSYETLRRIVSG